MLEIWDGKYKNEKRIHKRFLGWIIAILAHWSSPNLVRRPGWLRDVSWHLWKLFCTKIICLFTENLSVCVWMCLFMPHFRYNRRQTCCDDSGDCGTNCGGFEKLPFYTFFSFFLLKTSLYFLRCKTGWQFATFLLFEIKAKKKYMLVSDYLAKKIG